MMMTETKKRLAPQNCPLCGESQDIVVNGHITSKDDPTVALIQKDRGYSFCNCRNIFYTDWSNMKQGVYDADYHKKYDTDNVQQMSRNIVAQYSAYIVENMPIRGDMFRRSILDIGSITCSILDCFVHLTYKTYGMDIHDHPFGNHELIVSDFETYDISKAPDKFSLIWASHVIEHFKDPVAAIKKMRQMVCDGGLLFVAMPDTYFIDFGKPYKWGHWHLDEHHTLWGLEDFCNLLNECGFDIIVKRHNPQIDLICIGDMHILAKAI